MKDLENVYNTFNKWLSFEDTKRIDIMLATSLTREIKGTKIWIIFVGASGDWKSEMLNTLDDGGLNTYTIKKLTPRTIVTGNIAVGDLAPKLKDKVILITDFASLITLPPNDKAQLWAQLRDLYDGVAGGDSGSGKSVKYKDLNVTLLGASTPAIDNQILHNQSLGQRELIYRVNETKDREDLRNKLSENEEQEELMRMELRKAVQDFLLKKTFKRN